MIVVADREGDIDRIARQEGRLLQALSHVPAKCVESDFSSQFSFLNWQWDTAAIGLGCGLFIAPDRGSVGMAARSRQHGRRGELLRLSGRPRRTVSDCARPELQLNVFVFQNPRRRGQLYGAGGE